MIDEQAFALPHGVTLRCRAAGVAGPRVMLLHGFPEAAFAWDGMLAALASEAQLLAPNQRGYAGSSAPADVAAYRTRHLVADVAALIEAWAAPLDLLVAHDWGGAVAWSLAAQRPELLRRLLIVNAPHPAAFVRELRADPAQQRASAYMDWLVRPDAEAQLAADDFARLRRFLRSPWWTPDAAQRAAYEAAWHQGLTGPLNWYRASPLRPATAGAAMLDRVLLADDFARVEVPTRVLWGDGDTALLPGLLAGLERWVAQLTIERVADASHWIVHERPARVLAAIRAALASGPGGRA